MVSVKNFPISGMGLSDGWGWFDVQETWKNAQDQFGWTRITSRWGQR